MKYTIIYDNTFAGFLCAIFEIYRLHLPVAGILSKNETPLDLFSELYSVETREEWARRVERAIVNQAGENILDLLYCAFLSEEQGVENKLFTYIQMLFSKENAHFAKNPASLEMLPLLKLAQSVQREKHLFYGILRFQEVGENFFFAEIEPKYDILQLLANHFQRRFKKQQWVIFDSSRQYGLYYNLEAVDVIFIENFTPPEKQDQFTSFWQTYYKSAIIEDRLNKRQFRRMLPERYWKHLPERQKAYSL